MENFNNDFLSQSYSQSIERITGTKDHISNFQIPKKVLEVRQKAWINLFDKYSQEMSDDIELNVDTLEPDEEEIEKEVCKEEYSEQRIPMRKPATLVQYWVNTGNQPYNALLDENELSESGASLSEKEVTLSLSSVSTIINEKCKQKYKNESSCSSVNTAAYILSNANITNKVDTIAIRQSAQCGKNTNSLKNICTKDIKEGITDNMIQCLEDAKINCVTDNDNVNTNIPDIELYSMSKEYIASKICDQSITNIVTSADTETNMYLQNYKQIDKMSVLNTSQRSLDIQSTDDDQQFDETSRQLIGNDENSASNQDKMLEEDISYEKRENITAQEIITKDKNLTTFYRKKLYTGRNSPIDLIQTGRNSPIDLIQTKRHSISRLSETKQRLHPALDSDCMMKRETLLVHKNKSKNLSSFGKTNLDFKKKRKEKRRKSSISYKNIIDTSNEFSNDNRIKNFINDSSFKISSDHNNSDKQDDISECNNANIFVRNETCKQNLASLNTNPVVLLERITPFKRHLQSKSVKNNHITRESNVHNYKLNNNKVTCEIENVELETIDSDESTILVCQCKANGQHSTSFSKESDYSLNLKLSAEDDFSASNTEEKDGKLSNLKNTDLSQNKESCTILENLSPCLSVKDCTNVRFREIKVVVKRLPSTMKSEISNKDDIVWQKNVLNKSKTFSSNSYEANKIGNMKSQEIKIILERLPESVNKNSTNTTTKTKILSKNDIQQKEILNKFKTHSSNSYGINKTDNIKLREVKIVLERLPPNICFNDTNIFVHENIISENTNLHNNKRERRIKKMSRISACKNIEASTRTVDKVDSGYSLRMHTKSMKYNDPSKSDTLNIVAEHKVFDKIEFPNQYKNDNKMSQSNHSKYSILTFVSSDEDDVQLIQRPKKRLKFSKNDKLLSETNIENNLCNKTKFVATNKDKYHCNRNLRRVIFSSKEPKSTRKAFESANDKKESSGIEIKSFGNITTSLKMDKSGKFLFTSNKNDNDSVIKNLDKQKKRASFLDNINNSNERHSNAIVKKNGRDYKDDIHDIFQTKTFYTDSSDCEEDNSYTTSTRKTFKNSFVYHKSQYHKHANFKEFVNDSIGKRYSRRHSSSTLNSSFEKHDIANRIYDVKIGLESISKETKISKRLNNEKFNDSINSTINNIEKNISSYFINDTSIQNTTMQKEISSNISLGNNNFNSLSKNKQISDKSKNLATIQQDDVISTKLLIFQTKTYYDSDSNESL